MINVHQLTWEGASRSELMLQLKSPDQLTQQKNVWLDVTQLINLAWPFTTEHMEGPQLLAGGADLMIPAKPSRARQRSYRQTGPDQISERSGRRDFGAPLSDIRSSVVVTCVTPTSRCQAALRGDERSVSGRVWKLGPPQMPRLTPRAWPQVRSYALSSDNKRKEKQNKTKHQHVSHACLSIDWNVQTRQYEIIVQRIWRVLTSSFPNWTDFFRSSFSSSSHLLCHPFSAGCRLCLILVLWGLSHNQKMQSELFCSSATWGDHPAVSPKPRSHPLPPLHHVWYCCGRGSAR